MRTKRIKDGGSFEIAAGEVFRLNAITEQPQPESDTLKMRTKRGGHE